VLTLLEGYPNLLGNLSSIDYLSYIEGVGGLEIGNIADEVITIIDLLVFLV
jgi:hypothetical protein